MDTKDILFTRKWLNREEIDKNLKDVEFIVMAGPTLAQDPTTPIHFTIYLNTQETLPDEIVEQVFNKFVSDYKIIKVSDMVNGLHPVAFSLNDRDTAMPMFLMGESASVAEVEYTNMYIYDFEGNADGFDECKKEAKTGWTYSYNTGD